MVDVDAVLQGVRERDNWQRRLALLERSLGEVQARRRRLESRLRRVRRELARLPIAAESLETSTPAPPRPAEVYSAPRGPILR